MPNFNTLLGVPIGFQSTSRSLAGGVTASVGELTGSPVVVMSNSGANPGTYTTRTALLMIGDAPCQVGMTWLLILANNQATGVLTLGGGVGVTVTGTATVATNTARAYVGSIDSLSAISFTNVWAWTITA